MNGMQSSMQFVGIFIAIINIGCALASFGRRRIARGCGHLAFAGIVLICALVWSPRVQSEQDDGSVAHEQHSASNAVSEKAGAAGAESTTGKLPSTFRLIGLGVLAILTVGLTLMVAFKKFKGRNNLWAIIALVILFVIFRLLRGVLWPGFDEMGAETPEERGPAEPDIGQVSSEAAPSASPDEPSM